MAGNRKFPKYSAFYYFKYSPKHRETLTEFDKTPLMYPLLIKSGRTLGLNLHWVPINARFVFMQYFTQLNKVHIEKQRKRLVRVLYKHIKTDPRLKPALKGIRVYLTPRVSQVQMIGTDEMNKYLLAKPKYFSHKLKNPKYGVKPTMGIRHKKRGSAILRRKR